MPESFTQVPANAAGNKYRERQRVIGANTIQEPYFIPQKEEVLVARCFAASFRTLGNAATPQNIFTLENTAGSAVLIAIRSLTVRNDTTAATTVVTPIAKFFRTTAIPSGGTTLSKGLFDTTKTSAANVIARGANASDGGAATAITATASGGNLARGISRAHTLVGLLSSYPQHLLPVDVDEPFFIRAGEAIVVQITAAAAADNAATFHYTVAALWDEVTLP